MPSQRCLRSAAIQNQINAAVVLDLRWMLHMRTHRKSELVSVRESAVGHINMLSPAKTYMQACVRVCNAALR